VPRLLQVAPAAAPTAAVWPGWTQYVTCVPLVTYDARVSYGLVPPGPSAASVLPRSRGWTLQEDRPGKPGWIASGPPSATIEFALRVGPHPRVMLLFEKGYEGWGEVGIRTNSLRGEPQRLSAARVVRGDGDVMTQAELHVLYQAHWGMVPSSNFTLEISLLRPKFKLRLVSSC
jgi:hypothetical protein